MRFQEESLYDIIDDVGALMQSHYDEVADKRLTMNLDWGQYAELERLGMLKVFTARADEILIGYNAFFVHQSLHYADLKVAQNSVLFLCPQYRIGSVGARFIQYAERELKAVGVSKIVYFSTLAKDIRPLLNRFGYGDEEVMCGKFI